MRAAALLLSVSMALVGCARAQARTAESPPPRMAASSVRTAQVSTVYATRALKGSGFIGHDRLDSALKGPHFTTGLLWTATGESLADDAGWYQIKPVRAAAGQELIVAAIDPQASYAAFGSAKVTVEVTIGGTPTAVPGLPLPYDGKDPSAPAANLMFVMVSARQGVPVHLRATDAGRTAELDLRTGTVLATPFTLRQSGTSVSWQGNWPVARYYGDAVLNGTLTLATQPVVVATLANYAPGPGWAPAGEAFLIVPLPDVTCDDDNLLTCNDLTVTLSDTDAFTVRTNGATGTTLAGTHKIGLGLGASLDGDNGAVTFRVPAAVTTATVSLDWTGSTLATDGGATSWATTPGTTSVTVTLDH